MTNKHHHGTVSNMRSLTLIIILGLLGLGACTFPGRTQADLTITESGCAPGDFFLSAEREPVISIVNQSAIAMVFTLPKLNSWTSLPPGERVDFELPRYIMGEFEFFCLSDADHTALGGNNPFLCSMETVAIAPLARSSGIFTIAEHTRIREILDRAPPAPTP